MEQQRGSKARTLRVVLRGAGFGLQFLRRRPDLEQRVAQRGALLAQDSGMSRKVVLVQARLQVFQLCRDAFRPTIRASKGRGSLIRDLADGSPTRR